MDSQIHNSSIVLINLGGPHYEIIVPVDSPPQDPTVQPSSMSGPPDYVLHNPPPETNFIKTGKLGAFIVMTGHMYQTDSTRLVAPSSEDKTSQKVFAEKTFSDSTKILFKVSVDLLVFAFVRLLLCSDVLQVFCGLLGALLYMLFLAMDYRSGQSAMGKKTSALNFEDYMFFALNIFIDIFMIFLYVLLIFLCSCRY